MWREALQDTFLLILELHISAAVEIICDKNINVNVNVYSLISPCVQLSLQLAPLVLKLSHIQPHLLWGEFSICSLCCSCNQSLQFSFLVPPGTHHCWVDRGSMIRKACPTSLHMVGSMTRVLVTHRSAKTRLNVIWADMVTTRLATMCYHHCPKQPVTTMLTYPWKCTVLHCNHLGNTWKPLVLMT